MNTKLNYKIENRLVEVIQFDIEPRYEKLVKSNFPKLSYINHDIDGSIGIRPTYDPKLNMKVNEYYTVVEPAKFITVKPAENMSDEEFIFVYNKIMQLLEWAKDLPYES